MKKIEKLDKYDFGSSTSGTGDWRIGVLVDKMNEIIDALNKLEKRVSRNDSDLSFHRRIG